jgi:Zn-dependent protease with chaperone function
MHALLVLSSLLMVLLVGCGVLALLRRLGDWAARRDLQLLVLAAPAVSLGIGLGGLHHFAGQACFLSTPPWDYTLGIALPLGMGVVALAGLGLGLVRLALLARLGGRAGLPAGAALQAAVERLARQLGTPQPHVRLCASERPLALTCGVVRPTLLLSTWLVTYLDQRELEAVLAHELAHLARRDPLVTWLATVLRDAFCYLPTSWVAYRQLQQERELACDDLAVGVTRRPLALASALAKVWQRAAAGPALATAAPLAASAAIEARIRRLLAAPHPAAQHTCSRSAALGMGAVALAGLVVAEAGSIAVLLAPMGCGPSSWLGGLL